MSVNLTQLKTELLNDPAGLGYAPFVEIRNDTALAEVVNFARNGVAACPTNGVVGSAVTINRPDCDPSEILEAIDVRDFEASPAGVVNLALTQSWLESITQFARVRLAKDDGSKTKVRQNIDRLVSNVNGSQSRLNVVAVRFGSRAEQLFGAGVSVTVSDVSSALNN